MYRWNGHDWIQLAEPFGQPPVAAVAIAAGPAEAPVAAAPSNGKPGKPNWLDEAPPGLAAQHGSSAAAAPPTAGGAAPPVPAYGAPAPRRSSRLFIVVGGLALLVVLAAGGMTVGAQLLAHKATKTASPPTSATVLSQYDRADRFLNGKLGPAFDAADKSLPAIKTGCSGELTVDCRDALAATDQKLKDILAVIDHGDIPHCIAAPMKQFRQDIAAMEAGFAYSLTGFQTNSKTIVADGLRRVLGASTQAQTDANAVKTAQTACPK